MCIKTFMYPGDAYLWCCLGDGLNYTLQIEDMFQLPNQWLWRRLSWGSAGWVWTSEYPRGFRSVFWYPLHGSHHHFGREEKTGLGGGCLRASLGDTRGSGMSPRTVCERGRVRHLAPPGGPSLARWVSVWESETRTSIFDYIWTFVKLKCFDWISKQIWDV